MPAARSRGPRRWYGRGGRANNGGVSPTLHERLERCTWDLFWLPPEAARIDRAELLVVSAPRPAPYLNCVYRTRADAARVPALVEEVAGVHRDHGSRWSVVDTVETAALERALAAGGYRPTHAHDARVLAVRDFAPRRASEVEVRRVVDSELKLAWLC